MDRNKGTASDLKKEKARSLKMKIRQLAKRNEIVSAETIATVGDVTRDMEIDKDNTPSSDEFDEDLEEEYRNLNNMLDLPNDTYSLTKITAELPSCVKYGVRSGLIHLNMPHFSPLSRGYQVITTCLLYTSRCV
ncbi:Mediator of RNA polymerase II transcription subunit 17 [Temnothorax longispinosus]|uniref:Mediator of RNA polymerase II transcription subunit 17 n=1 Tax=Temnothorax longispinosus TaxID=300112 RepID=A0A4S2LDI3_9HYME|nr:Mediator of RNA polymerase II transcription subunit 17 [Temnothorax longispinosus]